MARLSIRLLGVFEVSLDERQVTSFESDKVRALLAFLAAEPGQAHRREMLGGLLWPERMDRTARANLRHVLANLRTALGDRKAEPPFLLITRQTIQFNLESEAWIDAIAFDRLLMDGAGFGERWSHDEDAVDLWRGEFLQGFSLKKSPAFENWVLPKREALRLQLASALRRLCEHWERGGETVRAISYTRRLVTLEPWDETAHQRLMRLLAGLGNYNEALRQYRRCARALEKELDIRPCQETNLLYERIQSDRVR